MTLPSSLRNTSLPLQVINFILSLCVLAVSAHICLVFHTQHATNPWWLPVWRDHFDTVGLIGVISGSAICFMTSILGLSIIFSQGRFRGDKRKERLMTWVLCALAVTGFVASLIAVVFPAVANARNPYSSDTVQTWTCRWKDVTGAPEDFVSLCRQSRFTSYAPIPLLIANVLLLAQSFQDIVSASRNRDPVPYGEEELVRITKSVSVIAVTPDKEKDDVQIQRA